MTSRHLGEEIELAEILPPGPVREAWIEGVTWAGWAALSDAVRHAQLALAACCDYRWQAAIDALVLAAESAVEARPAVPLLEAEASGGSGGRRPGRLPVYGAAVDLGRLVAGRHLDASVAAACLLSVAASIGLSEDEAVPTITSGMRRGMAQPWPR